MNDPLITSILSKSGDPEGGLRLLSRFEEAYFEMCGRKCDWSSAPSQRLLVLFGNSTALAEKLVRNPLWFNDITQDPAWNRQKTTQELQDEMNTLRSKLRSINGIPSPLVGEGWGEGDSDHPLPASPIKGEVGRKPCSTRQRRVSLRLKLRGINKLNQSNRTMTSGDVFLFQRFLRHFKYHQMIRIVARDLESSPPVQEIVSEWSNVADVIINAAYNTALTITSSSFGEPLIKLPEGDATTCTGTIIALGKLGSRELNMSSDIDLLCLYASDDGGSRGGPKGTLSNHEFFAKLIASLTKLLSEATEDGFAFRCDHDLRPEGPKGPLVNSLDAAERYYETFGHNWERQALIRARVVAGDMSLGQDFIKNVTPFIFRKSLSFQDLLHLKDMKGKMETQGKDVSDNIKLGRGGIRELEFIVQGFQQVFGGHLKEVRNPNTFEAMKALAQHQLIHPHGSKVLNEAYSFFRRLENMIQIVNDQQTHCLPHDPSEITALARRMSLNGEFSEKSRLLSEWRHHSRLVHRLFNGLFEADYERVELEEAISANLATCTTHEEKADSLPWFKHQEVKRLALLDLNNKIAIPDLLKRLSLVAEVVVHTAWLLACESLTERFGEPSLENGSRASFAILGLGRLGTSEIDYGSDLDLCFLYSGDGKTSGPEVINNPEFFTRLSQRIISLISVNSRYGRAYQIDSELRPSGRQGSLVTTLDTFCEYHLTKAKLWERQSLLKARVITGDETFCKEIKSTLVNLTYKTPLPDESQMLSEIFKLRQRFEIEKAKEKEGVYNLKIGCGGTADIEMIIQYSQLKNVKKQSELWVQNSFDLLKALLNINILNVEYYDILYSSLQFYRLLTARQRLFTNSATDLLDFNAPHIAALTQSLGYASPEVLKAELEKIRQSIRDLYNVYFLNPPIPPFTKGGKGGF